MISAGWPARNKAGEGRYWVFEKDLFGFGHHVFYEELSEMLAYCLLFAASLDLARALSGIELKVGQQRDNG